MSDVAVSCLVAGCKGAPSHVRRFTISREAWGEIEVEAAFCCDHLDLWSNEVPPCLDLELRGVVRKASA